MDARTSARLTLAILGGVGAACALAAVAEWRRYAHALRQPVPLALCVVLSVAALLALAALRLSPRSRLNAAVAALSIVVALFGIESALAVLAWRTQGDAQDLRAREAALAAGRSYDRRRIEDVVDRLRRRGEEAYPAVLVADVERSAARGPLPVFPMGGVAGSTQVLCRESGSYPTYRADEHGFRNPAGVWAQPSVELALVGDSFVLGFCVRDDEAFATLIRARVPGTLALGVVGSGPLVQLAAMREFLAPLRPPTVLWFYYEGNDLPNLELEHQYHDLPPYLAADFRAGLPNRQAEVDSLLRAFYRDALERARLGGDRPERVGRLATLRRILLLRHLGTALGGSLRPVAGIRLAEGFADLDRRMCCDLSAFRTVLDAAHSTVASWGGTLWFVYLPDYDRYERWGLSPIQTRARPQVLAAVREAGLPIIDLDSAFAAQSDPRALFYYPHSHYNPRGNRIVADVVLARLRK